MLGQHKKILIFVLIILYSINQLCFADTLETQLSRDQIMLGESIVVTFVVNSAFKRSPDFSVLQNDFEILNSNYGTSVNMVNGVTTMQTFWQLQLEPKRAGDLTIPEINFGNDKSQTRKLVVTDGQVMQPMQASNESQEQNVFVRAEVSNSSPYVQSQVLYTFKLYFRSQLIDPRIEIPTFKNVTYVQLENKPGYQTTINGKFYNVIEKKLAIFPKKTGKISLPPMRFQAYAIDNDTFNYNSPKNILLATKEINLSVRDIPANYANSAWLPAKKLSLSEEWSDKLGQWESNTPVIRTITLQAEGLRADQLPDISINKINGVDVYADRPKRSTKVENDKVITVLEQKVTYIPHDQQSINISPIKINWWNTVSNTNEIAQLKGMNVKVKTPVGVSKVSNQAILPSVNVTNVSSQQTKIVENAFYRSIWFWIACVLLFAWITTLWALLRKKSNTHSTISIQTSHKMNEKYFEQVCLSGEAMKAQQYLLDWAKNKWSDDVVNLSKLHELIKDESFQLALQELEQVLYAKKSETWNGQRLLTEFQRIKKTKGIINRKNNVFNKSDSTTLLPPLNP